jgi:predicted methyltransferase
MKLHWIGLLAALAMAGCNTMGGGGSNGPNADASNAAAVADAGRPQADRDRDAERKPAEMLRLAGVRPGISMAELLPGGGYFTRIFSKAVGPTGRVYTVIGDAAPNPARPQAVLALAADPAYPNIQVINQPFTSFHLPQPVDLVWTSQNYHDLHLARLNVDVAAVNRSVFQALRPGGRYVIVDHAALPGSPVTIADTLHRIDPAIVRREVEAAGFVFVSQSDTLHNAADPHTIPVFDPAIRGHTDQFVLVFRRPG